MSWNCRGLRGKIPRLANFVSDFDLICLQETLLRCHTPFSLSGFACIRNDISTCHQRGLCILIRNSIDFQVLNFSHIQHHSIEDQGIKIMVDQGPLYIINIYRHSKQIHPKKFFVTYFNPLLIILILFSWETLTPIILHGVARRLIE
ncbi:hypothetical protein ALC62_01816 [Cyphomyrmex costatus]|uniref:Endonuclease/exonuclease/phosphatase domain-containing protein n=1 Tax=Cyphomyrmex costatus TaxID=456900 RepID=A0A151IP26_9HYME|nr:hypothetical protein ALC62_01816 [Cyphomyrmex costatus]